MAQRASNLYKNIAAAWKTVVSAVTAAITWAKVVVESPSGPITAQEWITGAILVGGALGVYVVTNQRK